MPVQATNMAGSLQGVAEQISLDEAASVVIVTDGRTNVAGDPDRTRGTWRPAACVSTACWWARMTFLPDAAVEPVDFPDWIYKGGYDPPVP